MQTLLIALAILIAGYLVYGTFVSRVLGVDTTRTTPAYTRRDNVDYMPMPTWKVFLIQFLNIAGLGPIFGAIMGVMFGPAAFLWIVFGTIFAGAVHDFCAAFISLRSDGMSLPQIIGDQLGSNVRKVMNVLTILLMILVAAVFVLNPADIIAGMTPDYLDRTVWIAAIFVYYMLATLLPIDKLIGNLYPVFGFALLFMAAGILAVLVFGDYNLAAGWEEGIGNRYMKPLRDSHPIFPMMFVSIACGAISGFHATQSPMMARCLKNEQLAQPVFYGAMVAEGIVALIWAAAAIAFTGGYEELGAYMANGKTAGVLVKEISVNWLGTIGGLLALLGVVAAPITSGDTALRSARLIAADIFRFDQSKIWRRLIVSLPLFGLTYLIMCIDYNVMWRYFAWINQTIAMVTLWAITVWLARKGKLYVISLIPALFMTVVCVNYILFAPQPEGLGLPPAVATSTGIGVAALLLMLFVRNMKRNKTI